MIGWIKDRAINVVIYGAIILTVGYFILRPTKKETTTVEKGGTVNYYWKDAKVAPGFGGCVSIRALEKAKEK
jgi:hypothetical protein